MLHFELLTLIFKQEVLLVVLSALTKDPDLCAVSHTQVGMGHPLYTPTQLLTGQHIRLLNSSKHVATHLHSGRPVHVLTPGEGKVIQGEVESLARLGFYDPGTFYGSHSCVLCYHVRDEALWSSGDEGPVGGASACFGVVNWKEEMDRILLISCWYLLYSICITYDIFDFLKIVLH